MLILLLPTIITRKKQEPVLFLLLRASSKVSLLQISHHNKRCWISLSSRTRTTLTLTTTTRTTLCPPAAPTTTLSPSSFSTTTSLYNHRSIHHNYQQQQQQQQQQHYNENKKGEDHHPRNYHPQNDVGGATAATATVVRPPISYDNHDEDDDDTSKNSKFIFDDNKNYHYYHDYHHHRRHHHHQQQHHRQQAKSTQQQQQLQLQVLLQDIASSNFTTNGYKIWLKRYESQPTLCMAILQRIKQLYYHQQIHHHHHQQQQTGHAQTTSTPTTTTAAATCQPTAEIYAMVITSIARYGDNPQAAHDLLNELLECFRQFDPHQQQQQQQQRAYQTNFFTPTYDCFDQVIIAWAKSSGYRSHPITITTTITGANNTNTTSSSSAATTPYSNHDLETMAADAGDMALLVLEQFLAHTQLLPITMLPPPDVITYMHVMEAMKKKKIKIKKTISNSSGRNDDDDDDDVRHTMRAAIRCQALLERMENLFQQQQQHDDPHVHAAKPDAKCYNVVLDAWAQAAGAAATASAVSTRGTSRHHQKHHRHHAAAAATTAAMRAEKLLRHMQHLYQHQGNTLVQPTDVSYTSCIHAWANAAMSSSSSTTTTTTTTTTKLSFATKRAQALWNEMMHRLYHPHYSCYHQYHHHHHHCPPNSSSSGSSHAVGRFTSTSPPSSWWKRNSTSSSSSSSSSSSQQQNKQSKKQPPPPPPPAHALGALLMAWNRNTNMRPDVTARRAQAMYDEYTAYFGKPTMISSRYDQRSSSNWYPAATTNVNMNQAAPPLAALLQAWAKAGDAARAEALLREWYHDENQQRHAKMTNSSTNNNNYYNNGATTTAITRAPIKRLMYDDAARQTSSSSSTSNATTTTTTGDHILFNIVLDAWSRSSRPDAPDRAMALYQELVSRHIRPNLHILVVLITTWGRSRHPDRVEHAEALFQTIIEQQAQQVGRNNHINYSNNNNNNNKASLRRRPPPTTTTSSIIILSPDDNITIAYNAMIDAYVNGNKWDQAEALLRQQMHLSEANVISFSTVLKGWSLSNLSMAGPRADALFQWMQHLYQQGQITFPPNTMCYNHVIRAWSHSIPSVGVVVPASVPTTASFDSVVVTNKNHPADAELVIVERVEALMAQMRQRGDSMPNIHTYIAYLQTLVQCQHLPSKAERARMTLQEINRLGIPTTGHVWKLAKSCGVVSNADGDVVAAFRTDHDDGGGLANAIQRIQHTRRLCDIETEDKS